MNQKPANLRQATTIVGLAAIAAVHVMDLPGKFAETPYLAWGYIGVIAAAAILIERIANGARRQDFVIAALLSAAVLLGFIVNRTVGMPGATGDIGNWFEPLGLLSMFVESFTLGQSVLALKALAKARS